MPIRSFFALVGLCTLSPLVLTSSGQTPADTSPTLTLHAGTRIVLTDVTVTDRHGNPVHGLPASAFHISDNNEPEVLASFD
jgi:hypothetical protein